MKRIAPVAVLAPVFVALAAWSWRRWPDLLVDFGQQLYVPWRLTAGERLHREIVLLHGPLSQHLNALWFALFGPSFTVLIVVNLIVLGLLTWIVYRIVRRVASPLTATLSCLVLLSVFGFSQYLTTGNYNFIAPYTHESTHGMLLAAGMILALAHALDEGGPWAWAIAGLCLGLTCLTKVDVALAALATAVVGLACAVLIRRARARDMVGFGAGAVAPAAVFFVYFATYLPPGRALRAVGGGFAALSGEVARNPFYSRVAGLDDPLGNLKRMIVMAAVAVGLVLAGVLVDVVARKWGRKPTVIAWVAGTALFIVLVSKPEIVPWLELPRGFPLLASIIGAGVAILLWRARGDVSRRRVLIPALLVSVFAVAVVAKTALNLHAYHFGFYLAPPATLLLMVCCLEGIPRFLKAHLDGGVVFKVVAFAAVAAGTVFYLRWSDKVYEAKDLPVGRDGDVIVTYSPRYNESGPIVAETLDWLEKNTTPGETFVGFPEGIMLNYLARRPARTTCMNYVMTEIILFGEKNLLDQLREDPPDYVLLVHKDTSEFGVGFFGQDPRYGREIMTWVNRNYRAVAQFGAEPFRSRRFGIRILKRGVGR